MLDDAAEVHDGDPVGEMRGRRQVMGDHQDREPAAAQPVQELQDSGPDRDVEHRDRLVGDEQARLEHERGCDRHALALTAGELVRVTVEEELGRRELDALQGLPDKLEALSLRPAEAVDEQRLLHGRPDAEARVERFVRVLVDDLDLPAERAKRPRAEAVVMSRPSYRIAPDTGSTRRSTAWAVVVFPQPDSPTSATSSPLPTASDTPSTACTACFGRRASKPTSPRGTG